MSDTASNGFVAGVDDECMAPRKFRAPVQARSQQRMAQALAAAEQLLHEVGPEKASIPEIAKRSGVPRASLYQYFPDKYALFAYLAAGYIRQVSEAIALEFAQLQLQQLPWRQLVSGIVQAAANYYNSHPVASILVLNGAFSHYHREAHLAKDEALGQLFRAHLTRSGELRSLPDDPDVATLAVEIAFACMTYGYGLHGRITPDIAQEAAQAAIAYLSQWEEATPGKQRR